MSVKIMLLLGFLGLMAYSGLTALSSVAASTKCYHERIEQAVNGE
jgi:hypothetical protein